MSFSSEAASRFSFAIESLRFLIWAFIALSARLRSSRAESTAVSCCRLSDSRVASRSRSAASASAAASSSATIPWISAIFPARARPKYA